MDVDYLFRLGILAVLAGLLWLVFRPKHCLRIATRDGRVLRHSGLPASKSKQVIEFLEQQVPLAGKVTILANRDAAGRLRISFRGRIPSDIGQQIRNFLKMNL